MTSSVDLRATELECEQTIIQAAKAAGWMVHGERAAVSNGKWSTPIKGDAGFPDLVIVNPRTGQLLIVELKRRPNRATDDQIRWLAAFEMAFQGLPRQRFRVLLAFVPEELAELLALLTDRSAWEV